MAGYLAVSTSDNGVYVVMAPLPLDCLVSIVAC